MVIKGMSPPFLMAASVPLSVGNGPIVNLIGGEHQTLSSFHVDPPLLAAASILMRTTFTTVPGLR
jgi:hypothetical protein